MSRKKTKRISAIISMLLVVTVLFCGNVFASEAKLITVGNVNGVEVGGGVGDEGIMPALAHNSLYVNKITVYPAYVFSGGRYFDHSVSQSQSFSLTSSVKLRITAAQRANLSSRFSSVTGMAQNGWRVKIDYFIDAGTPVSIEGRADKPFKEKAWNGAGVFQYNTATMEYVNDWTGVFTFLQNGPGTKSFGAYIAYV